MKMVSDFVSNASISALYGVFGFHIETYKRNKREGHLGRAMGALNQAHKLGAGGERFDLKLNQLINLYSAHPWNLEGIE